MHHQRLQGDATKGKRRRPPQLRTLIEYANGFFDEPAYLEGSANWEVIQGARRARYSPTTVLTMYRTATAPVRLTNGLFRQRTFPTPAECLTIYQAVTWGEVTGLTLTGDNITAWVYENLGASSFFNDLFTAAECFLKVDALTATCAICEQQPCAALNRTFPPLWMVTKRDPPAGKSPEALRYACYKSCHPKYGFSRVPLPDCWLLAIRLCLPGGPITGFRPRYLKKRAVEVVVEIPVAPDEPDDAFVNFEDFPLPEPAGEDHDHGGDENDDDDDGPPLLDPRNNR